MRTTSETDILPLSPTLGASKQAELMTNHRSRTNSNHSERDSVFSDCTFIPSSPSSPASLLPSPNASCEDDDDYFNEYLCPTDSEDESSYFSHEMNDEFYVEQHLSPTKLNFVNDLQDKGYQRSKRSKKKMNAHRQIKTKHARSIQIKSHNKHLYIHHRLAKKVALDEPRYHCIPSPQPTPLYSLEELRSLIHQHRRMYHPSYLFYSTPKRQHGTSKYSNETYIDESQVNLAIYQDYTLNEYNIPDEPTYDDTMIDFLLDMQNRDLSPEDYEMLLRLDERVQRKTINTNIFDTLPTIVVDPTHVDDRCTICMEKYNLGQELKFLPCTHLFHSNCIETYLKEFSNQCPLDNLPLL